jgi:hypothetical protein
MTSNNLFLREISVRSQNEDVAAVIRLYNWMLSKGRTLINVGELADFYKEGNEGKKIKNQANQAMWLRGWTVL